MSSPNGMVKDLQLAKITKQGIEIISYDSITDACVWKKSIIKRDVVKRDDFKEAKFNKFLKNTARHSKEEIEKDRYRSQITSLGYMMHSYVVPTKTKLCISLDERLTDSLSKDGQSGKTLKQKAIEQIKPCALITGESFDPKSTFAWQQLDRDTVVVIIDDIGEDCDFDNFNSLLSIGIGVEKKYGHKFHIPQHLMPKFIFSTNRTPKQILGATREERQHIQEFSDYYTIKKEEGIREPIVDEFGEMFFDEWDTDEWQKFDWFMLNCIVTHLKDGLIQAEPVAVANNAIMQQFGREIHHFLFEEEVIKLGITYTSKELYQEFTGEEGNPERTELGNTMKKLKPAIRLYCEFKKWKCIEKRDKRGTILKIKS